jgi:hypothetical protein
VAERDDIDGNRTPTAAGDGGEPMNSTTSGHEPLQAGTAAPATDVIITADPVAPARRRGPDPLALVVGLATLAMAVFAFVGELPDLSGFDPRWLLAGGAVVVGLMLLVGNLRNRSGGRRGGS